MSTESLTVLAPHLISSVTLAINNSYILIIPCTRRGRRVRQVIINTGWLYYHSFHNYFRGGGESIIRIKVRVLGNRKYAEKTGNTLLLDLPHKWVACRLTRS